MAQYQIWRTQWYHDDVEDMGIQDLDDLQVKILKGLDFTVVKLKTYHAQCTICEDYFESAVTFEEARQKADAHDLKCHSNKKDKVKVPKSIFGWSKV